MSRGRFLLLSFLIGAGGLAIFRLMLGDLMFAYGRPAAEIPLSAVLAGLFMVGRARWVAERRPCEEDARSWRRHDVVWQATTFGLLLFLIAAGLALGHVMGQPGF